MRSHGFRSFSLEATGLRLLDRPFVVGDRVSSLEDPESLGLVLEVGAPPPAVRRRFKLLFKASCHSSSYSWLLSAILLRSIKWILYLIRRSLCLWFKQDMRAHVLGLNSLGSSWNGDVMSVEGYQEAQERYSQALAEASDGAARVAALLGRGEPLGEGLGHHMRP